MIEYSKEVYLANRVALQAALLRQVRSFKRRLADRSITLSMRGNADWRFDHRSLGYVDVIAYASGYQKPGDPICDDLVVKLNRPNWFQPSNPYGWRALTSYEYLPRLQELIFELLYEKRMDAVALTYPGKWLRLIHDGEQFTAKADPVANK
jgi:hypothetical protein